MKQQLAKLRALMAGVYDYVGLFHRPEPTAHRPAEPRKEAEARFGKGIFAQQKIHDFIVGFQTAGKYIDRFGRGRRRRTAW